MFELIAEVASLNPAALGGGLSPFVLAILAALRASQQEVEDLKKKSSNLRRKLRRERRRRRSNATSRSIATPSVKETIDRTARTIEDTCRHVTEMAEKRPAARSRKSSPRKRKNTETIETAEAPNETPPE